MIHKIIPAERASSVTPNDSTNFEPTRGIYAGASGDLHVLMANGDEATFVGLAAGVVHPLSVVRVYSTSTTATGILALR